MKTHSYTMSESETTSGLNWKVIRGEALAGIKPLSLWQILLLRLENQTKTRHIIHFLTTINRGG